MGRIVIAEPSLSDAATLSTFGGDLLPIENLQKLQPGQAGRSSSISGAAVEVDLGAAAEINLVGLLHTNATSAATWRIRAAATQGDLTASPGYDSTAISVWPTTGLETFAFVHGLLWLGATPQTFRFWRIDLVDAANPAGFVKAGRLYVTKAWQPTRNRAIPMPLGFEDPSTQEVARGGQTYPLALPKRRVQTFVLPFLSEAEMYANAFELDRLRGRSGDILVIPDPDKPALIQQQTIYGLQAELGTINEAAFNLFEKQFNIRELLP